MPSVTAILGVGPSRGTGAALARAFAKRNGDIVALLARSPGKLDSLAQEIRKSGGKAEPIVCDVTNEQSVADAFAKIKELGTLRTAIMNAAGGFKVSKFLDLSLPDKAFEVETTGAFLFSQAALRAFPPEQQGTSTLIFTGATAAVRGSAKFAAFAAPKFAVRALSQCLAREFGPQGVHVAHIIIDGLIATERVEGMTGSAGGPDEVRLSQARDVPYVMQRLDPDAIAQSYVAIADQPRSAWTHELDLRPYSEKW